MKMNSITELLEGLNENQANAVKIQKNAVIGAGAGSGKTKVLAARYVYFVVEKGLDVENIVTLTFAKKAATEMYERIYAELKKIDNPKARKAIEKFHLANITTIDSFCNAIAKTACKKFGISPDFTIDNEEAGKMAYRISLDFFLRHRSNSVMQHFLAEEKIDGFILKLFYKMLTEYVLVTKPIDFKKGLQNQIEENQKNAKKLLSGCELQVNHINTLSPDEDKFIQEAQTILKEKYKPIEFISDKDFPVFLNCIKTISKIRSGKRSGDVPEIKAVLKECYTELLNAYNFEYNKTYLESFFPLLDELQKEYISKKKQLGILTFGDVSRLATDALIEDTELRRFYKENTELIMIDEFQDNNELQRDLLFLIAENIDRAEKSVPKPEELCSGKLFFVGDEKQSIYAYRGADVSAFRKLSDDIGFDDNGKTRLLTNYRTHSVLINLFNKIFSKVFYSEVNTPNAGEKIPSYEAEYYHVTSLTGLKEIKPKLEILLADKNRFTELSTEYLSPIETEAYNLAIRIKELYNAKTLVRKKDKAEPCSWNSFAVLMRASTHQSVYERIFRILGIPYASIQQKGLFQDAPLNDLYAVLKLTVYPQDKKTYAQVLRSPFVNIDDDAFAILLLNFKTAFQKNLSDMLDGENKTVYLRACNLFEKMQQNIKVMNCAELVTFLWYEEGYRYILLEKQENTRYLELYDYFFELARKADLKGLTVSQFVDSLSEYIEKNKKLDDMQIPIEHSKDAVCFLTVHKSKGLEFPIVCIPSCGSRGKNEEKDGLIFYNKTFEAVIHAPQVPDYPEQKNIIFESLREESNLKLLAETKRLLYVAMTRAESYIIMTSGESHLDNKNIAEEPRTLEEILQVLKQPSDVSNKSFFELLLPALPQDDENIIFTEIMPEKRNVLFRKKEQNSKIDFSEIYTKAEIKEFKYSKKRITAATQLDKKEKFIKPAEETFYLINEYQNILINNSTNQEEDFSAAQLGTIAHAAIEARFLKKDFIYPSDTEKKIAPWVNNFFKSDIYSRAEKSEKLKCEYGFLTEYNGQTVSGQIDLIFKTNGIIYIIDYKTDEKEEPENHRVQLMVYKKAAADLALYLQETDPVKIIKPAAEKQGLLFSESIAAGSNPISFDAKRQVFEFSAQIKAFVFYLKTGNYFEIE